MPQVLPLWELENAIRDSDLSGNLAHELPPLPVPVVTLFHSTHQPSLEGSRRKTAALRVSAEGKAFNYLFCAGGQRDCLSRFLALFTFPKLKNLAFAGGWISSSSVDLAPTPPKFGSFKTGHVVARGLSLVDSMDSPGWSRNGTSPGRSFLRRRTFE